MKFVNKLISSAFLLIIFLPGLQMLFGIFEEEVLHGVEENKNVDFPNLEWKDLLDQSFQKELELYFDRNIGFRGALVRSDNQINFSLFNEVSASYASPLIVGKDNSLFEKLYIDSLNGRWLISDKQIERLSQKLVRVQELFEKRSVSFLVFVTPSKAVINFEQIPARYLNPDRPRDEASNYRRLVRVLDQNKINYLDSRSILESWKAQGYLKLFPKAGTHWSQLTACKVSALLFEKLESISATKLPKVICSPTKELGAPLPFDRDLADLANLWSADSIYETLEYPVEVEGSQVVQKDAPKMLFVGGSFLWSMFHYMDKQGVYSERDMFYYFSRRFTYPSGENSPIDKKRLDWTGDILKNRFVVLEVNEANIHTLGSGFLEEAITKLRTLLAEEDDRKAFSSVDF